MLESVVTDLQIGGERRGSATGARFDVEDPATGEVIASVADGTADDAVAALEAAVASRAEWAATAPRARGEILRRAFELLVERIDDLALLMTLEMGKPLADSRAEITYAAEFFRWFAEEAVRIDGRYAVAPAGNSRLVVMHQPVGPCLLITPWNFPMAMATRKIGAAIAAGCTMVLKPAALTPLSAFALAAMLEEAGLPPACSTWSPPPRPRASPSRCWPTPGSASCRSPVPPRWVACSPSWRRRTSSGSRWSSAATPRSWCSPTPTSTRRSTVRCSPRCATWARRAPPPTASSSTSRSPTPSRDGSPSASAP